MAAALFKNKFRQTMRKIFFFSILFAAATDCFAQQNPAQAAYRVLADSCFAYLEKGDSLRFGNTYPKILAAYEKADNPEMTALREELLALRTRDQSIRILLIDARERYGRDSEMARKVHRQMKIIDSVSAIRAQRTVDRYGWPGKDDIGEEACEALFLCIQHADGTDIQQKYLPILEQAVREGNAEPWHLAFLTDRVRMNRGEKQIYGTQSISGKEPYIVPMEDPDRVDSLRQSIGLGPITDYAASLGIQLDLKKYKENLPRYEQLYKEWHEAYRPNE